MTGPIKGLDYTASELNKARDKMHKPKFEFNEFTYDWVNDPQKGYEILLKHNNKVIWRMSGFGITKEHAINDFKKNLNKWVDIVFKITDEKF